jgi:uncharacterized heparinase superfamily protein
MAISRLSRRPIAEVDLGSQTTTFVRVRLLGITARALLGRLRRPLAIPERLFSAMRGVRSQRLLIALQDIRTADPIAADHIYAGHFSLAGKAVSTHGYSPFVIAAPSVAWSEALHGFGWLRHLRAADTALSRANAHALVEDWLNLDARGGKSMDRVVARDPRVISRRLISWLSQSPIILENADHAFYRRFVRAIEAHVAALERWLVEGLEGDARLTAVVACAHAGLCLEGANGLLHRATHLLSKELQEQILRDGGHVSRNPRVLVELLVDLLPTRQAFVARNIAAPEALLNAIDRMTPMLRMFRHADGALAGFNGMGVSEPETLATLLAHGDVGDAAVLDAPYSGYQRLEAADAIVIADVGAPPRWMFSREAHAGCLAFEFSSGLHRLIINCGAPQDDSREAREAARATAAHSTLVIDDHSSCRFASTGSRSAMAGMVLEGPSLVEVKRWLDEADGQCIDAVHDGYARRYGALHRRTLRLAGDGASLAGEDRVAPVGKSTPPVGKSLAVRFHLHPTVRAELSTDSGQVLLKSPSGEEWWFEAAGRPISLEESIFFAAPGGATATTQIVLRDAVTENECLNWSFTRSKSMEDPAASGSDGPPQPQS